MRKFRENPCSFFYASNFILLAQIPVSLTPCKPNPCGPNSQCQPRGDESVCTCLPDFIGSPPNCRAECVSNSECSNHLACINKKCRDPCIGSCGANANCHVVSHTPMCSCINGYTGDPFTQCILRERKYHLGKTDMILLIICYMFEIQKILQN